MIPFMLASGFFLNLKSIPSYLEWLKFISPHRYIFAAMLQNQFGPMASVWCLIWRAAMHPHASMLVTLRLLFGQKLRCDPDETMTGLSGGDFCPFETGRQVLEFLSIEPDTFWTNIYWSIFTFALFRLAAFFALRVSANVHGSSSKSK